jgi:uncharacterized membrane protein
MHGKATSASFFLGSVICYALSGITHDAVFWPRAAVTMIAFGLVAALLATPALRATDHTHVLLDLGVVVLFALALWQGWHNHHNPLAIGLSVAGVVFLGAAGWLAGTLTFGRHAGVAPHRRRARTISGTITSESRDPLMRR